MGPRRTGRSDMPSDPAGAVRALRLCRDAMIDVCKSVTPTGPVYHGASMVISAIDAFTTLLTGNRHYFWAGGSAPVQGPAAEARDQAVREDGETPT